MKTSVELPDDLLEKVKKYNKTHPNRPINVSGVCRLALEKEIEDISKE